MTIASASSRTFASLNRHRNYRLYFGGQVVSLTGTWMQNIAQAWFIIELTHGSAFAVGALALCQFGPYALGGLFGGSLADRLNGRRALVFTQSASMLVAAALAGLALTHSAQVWEVFLLAAASGAVLILDTPVRQAFTIQMVGRAELPNAIALNSSLFNASRVFGPAVAGLLIATTGVGICFLLNAISYIAVIAALVMMRDSELHPVDHGDVRPTLLRGVGEGLAYAWRTPSVRLVLGLMLVISTLAINFNVLLPVLAAHTLASGPEVFGIVSAAFGGGALVGALTSAALSRASLKVMLVGALGFGASLLLLAPVTSVWLACVLLVVTGFTFSLYGSQSNSSLQMVVPDRLRGRVLSLYGYVFFGTAPLGGLFTGWLCDGFGTWLYLIVAGGVSVAAAAGAVALVRVGRTALPERTSRLGMGGADASTVTARE
ncbi:MAG: MFS transporter [Candidatus Dormibacteraeota bacterium]|uniref:MFS transporter n=1 Tax=Candidatus Amunia macphersoniae TaxID=3127014 RepID=A0A934KMK4_9BACT|nr:MFS transporter [Candidatus Dormibacteraeota bacterium]